VSILLCRKLLDGANDWLHKNTEMQVRSCETVTWMSHDVKSLSSSNSELMMLSKRVAEHVQTFNVRGLRSVVHCCISQLSQIFYYRRGGVVYIFAAVCLSVCHAIAFEVVDVESAFFVCRYAYVF